MYLYSISYTCITTVVPPNTILKPSETMHVYCIDIYTDLINLPFLPNCTFKLFSSIIFEMIFCFNCFLSIRYEVKFQAVHDCGGAYIKLLAKDDKLDLVWRQSLLHSIFKCIILNFNCSFELV